MKRDIIGDIFLGGVLLSLLFLFSFPAYFCYTRNVPRDIFLFERIMSVCFLLGLVMSVIWACWKKKVWVAGYLFLRITGISPEVVPAEDRAPAQQTRQEYHRYAAVYVF